MVDDDDLSDLLEYQRDKTLGGDDWDDTIEFEVTTPNTLAHEVSEDDIEVLADASGIRAWTHETGQWRIIEIEEK